MPIHGNYSNGAGVVVNVIENAGTITFAGVGNLDYHGNLQYTVEAGSLDIHILMAQPERQNLGAFLVWICANTAIWHRKPQIRALATAQEAINFYASLAFAPDPTELDAAMTAVAGDDTARPPHMYVSTYVAQTGACLDAAWKSCGGHWRPA